MAYTEQGVAFGKGWGEVPYEAGYESEAKADRPPSPMSTTAHDLERSLSRAEKAFAVLAERLQPYLQQQDEPRPLKDETAVRAMPSGTSTAVRELRDVVDRLDNFGSRVSGVTDRLEL